MTNPASLARRLTDLLGLARPPVALARTDAPPAGVAVSRDPRPSACAQWRAAETSVFAVSAADHMACPIGALVAGFPLTPEATQELQSGVAMMCEVGYLDPAEVAHIPTLPAGGTHMVYGPLAQFPLAPAAVLLWVDAAQAMILREATGDARWRAEGTTGFSGRPGCAAIPLAIKQGRAALSLGCTGMRMFTETDPSLLLAVLPGQGLAEQVDRLEKTVEANCAMRGAYAAKKAAR